ncbi:hypothetical protein AcV5_007412 [Taiwanofungus camphoratus]|nr:hypothetical protein AcV7_005837 [Antrodia cinnamomea]KAI0926686.1 hypothetical protein AcV5_007412 [Antrodia cinnamomea]
MGAGQSTASQAPARALHVLRVTPSSPASQTTIEPFFDFVVGFKGDTLSSNKTIDAAELEKIVESHEGRTLDLLVWNSKSQQTRVVPIVPARDWSLPHSKIPDPQEPEAERKPSLLGLSMRMCEPEFALDNVWHVLDVLEGSPAESAGLVPYGDWIIGWSGGALSAEGDFYDIVEAHIEKPLQVYVYSYDFDTIREVVLVPNRQWGGEGLLGCVFGSVFLLPEAAACDIESLLHRFGLLHRIPPLPADREPGSIPLELTQESDEFEEQQLFVPADLPGEPEIVEESEDTHWEHHQWMQDAYARRYDHDSAYGASSTYVSYAGHESSTPSRKATGSPEEENLNGYMQDAQDPDGQSSIQTHIIEHEHGSRSPTESAVQITPLRSASFTTPRSSTPTPARSLGSFMNGDSSRPS